MKFFPSCISIFGAFLTSKYIYVFSLFFESITAIFVAPSDFAVIFPFWSTSAIFPSNISNVISPTSIFPICLFVSSIIILLLSI